MGVQKNQGFTIVEISMVLAISSLLLLGMMTGINLAVQRQRFSDSVNGSQSFLQQQFNFTQNTINNRTMGDCGDPNNPGNGTPDPSGRGASGCLVIGKLIEFEEATGGDESTIYSFDVLGRDVDTQVPPFDDDSDIELIRAINPTAIKQATLDTHYDVPWGAQINALRDANGTGVGSQVRFIAIFRSPRTGVVHVYKIDGPYFANTTQNSRRLLVPDIQEIANDSVKMCISSVDLVANSAMLEVIPLGSQDGVVTHFNDDARENYPCA